MIFRINKHFTEEHFLFEKQGGKDFVQNKIQAELKEKLRQEVSNAVPHLAFTTLIADIKNGIDGSALVVVLTWEQRNQISELLKGIPKETGDKIKNLIDYGTLESPLKK